MKHRKYGGSTAARTIACPAWTSMLHKAPPRKSSPFAELGTALHDCMEVMLGDDKLSPSSFVHSKVNGIEITMDMAMEKLQPAIEAFDSLCEEYDLDEYEPEVEVYLHEQVGGFVDVIARGDDVVVIADWKFGDGVQVFADESAQGLFYALCARSTPDFEDFFKDASKLVIAIIQPNTQGLPVLRTWECDVEFIDKFKIEMEAAISKAEAGTSEPVAGDHCKFCPNMLICPAKTGLQERAARLPEKSQILDNLSEALKVAGDIEKWVKEVKTIAHEQMELGVQIAGFKLVPKRASRQYNDHDQVAHIVQKAKKLLKEDCYDYKLKSPAQLEKVCKSKGYDFTKKIAPFISSVSSGTTIAKEDDKRPAILSAGAFKALADKLS